MNSSDKIDQEEKVYRKGRENVSDCLAAKKVSFNESKWNNFSYPVTEHSKSLRAEFVYIKETVGSAYKLS